MGTAALYHLVSHPKLPASSKITLIEAASSLAPGASGKSGGFLAKDWHGPATASIADLSFRLHRELAEEHGGRDKWGYREVETLSLEFDDSSSSTTKKKSHQSAPKGLDWVDTNSIQATSRLGGSGSTAQVTPLPLVHHLAQLAQDRAKAKDVDVDIRLNTYVEAAELDEAGEKVQGVSVSSTKSGSSSSSSRESIPCTHLILSAGPWLGGLVSSMFPRNFITSRRFLNSASYVEGSRAHSIVVRGTRPASEHCLFTEMSYGGSDKAGPAAAAPEVYARGDGTVYVCGGSDEEPLPRLAEEVSHDAKKTAALVEQTAALSPEVLAPQAGAKVEKEQACYLPIPQRGNFIVAGDSKSGVWIGGGGGSCWGITMGLGAGKCVSELVLEGEAKSADVSMLRG